MTHDEALDIIERWAVQLWQPKTYRREPGKMAESPDLMLWCNPWFVPVIEVKVSRENWMADQRKPHRNGSAPALGTHIWPAAPHGLIEPYEAEQRDMGLIIIGPDGPFILSDAPRRNPRRNKDDDYMLLINSVAREDCEQGAGERYAARMQQTQGRRLTKSQAAQVRNAVMDGCGSVSDVRRWIARNGEPAPSPARIATGALNDEVEGVLATTDPITRQTMLAPELETEQEG